MCGFVGLLNLKSKRNNEQLENIITEMAGFIKHRGPDAFGLYHSGPCFLAHQRLSIIDLSNSGKQPMSNEDKSVWIAYNGETYNFKDLKLDYKLGEKHHFKSKADTEVIIHLYEELGIDVLKHLNGMYAFALWDDKKKSLLLARDPFGIKPLFYTISGGVLCFASELKALISFPDYTPGPSLEALYHFLSYDYVPDTHTAFAGIKELRPGHMLTISMDHPEPEITRFFDIDYAVDQTMNEADAIDMSLDYLTKGVERQLIADVPVGVMLSGGMDSSALTALMAKIRGNSDFHTFSLAFDDLSFDESPFAKIVADQIGTHHHEIRVTPEKVLDLLPKYLTYIDEPYADGSAIPTFLLAECAKDYITVLLSGEGGDEVYAGYDTYAAYKVRSLYRNLVPGFLRKGVIKPLVHLLPVSDKKLSLEFKAKRFTEGAELDVPTSHFFWRAVLSPDVKREVVSGFDRFKDFHSSEEFFINAYKHCNAKDDLNRLMYLEFSYHLPDDLMIKNDRMTMAHSIEARVPFTDTDLVRFLATVPVKHKMKGMRKKHLLRKGLEGLLPQNILDKKKVGLEMPYSRWFRTELRDLAEDTMSEERLEKTGLFNGKKIRLLWDEHMALKKDHGRFFWGLLNYMLWYDVYIDKHNFKTYQSKVREPRNYSGN
ncbi:MAG: asparagine synthase (glutamine-hydrolyzing) [Spirochaetales bacterium]|nr:asparagine synthase (glutamine-hydrolyzing) [Spirochaetales bacterium]